MPKADRRARRPRSSTAASRAPTPGDRLTRQPVQEAGHLLARIPETPHLARAVPRLPPVVLHRLIQSCGLEACGELVALTTPEQLSAIFDLDLWRGARAGSDEALDAARFVEWLEVLGESGASFAARRLAGIDAALVIAALADYLVVFDPAVVDGAEAVAATAMRDDLRCEIGGYVVVARRTDSWDAIVDVLVALDDECRDYFHRVMRGCRQLSNSKPEIDGLDDLLADSEQVRFDLAFDRERRRDRLGYVTAAQARAFLNVSRQVHLAQERMPSRNPIATAYFRAADGADVPSEHLPSSESGDSSPSEQSTSAVAAVVEALLDAGIMPDSPRALLDPADGRTGRLARFQQQMQFVRDHDPAAHALRSHELAFLANAIAAGCSLQARPFTPREAFDAAAATCNLGLESWPRQWLTQRPRPSLPATEGGPSLADDFLAEHDLASVFQVGWTVLHQDVCVFVTEQLLGVLGRLQCGDREIQLALHKLRREMARHLEAGAPWQSRGDLDVIALLDMPAWAALLGLIGECPVMLANVAATGPSRPLSVNPSAFEFISEKRHISSVRAFMRSLPDALSG